VFGGESAGQGLCTLADANDLWTSTPCDDPLLNLTGYTSSKGSGSSAGTCSNAMAALLVQAHTVRALLDFSGVATLFSCGLAWAESFAVQWGGLKVYKYICMCQALSRCISPNLFF
jgi:bacterioferritin-associated ferredoxin